MNHNIMPLSLNYALNYYQWWGVLLYESSKISLQHAVLDDGTLNEISFHILYERAQLQWLFEALEIKMFKHIYE